MRDPDRTFRFSVLVVEDTPGWVDACRSALDQAFRQGPFERVRFAGTAGEARREVAERRFHFISIDQNIPDKIDESVANDYGLNFCEFLASANHTALKVIYTAFGENSFANRIGRLGKSEYWEKSASGRDIHEKLIYSPTGWAEKIRSMLQESYASSFLEVAGSRLPIKMAEYARHAFAAHSTNSFREQVELRLNLWEAALDLAWAQTLALCRVAGITAPSGSFTTPAEMESRLSTLWVKLAAQKSWLDPWRRYIGIGHRETGEGAGQSFLKGASEPCRLLRNRLAHTHRNRGDGFGAGQEGGDWENHLADLYNPFLFLTDALAFWIENPLVIDPRLHPHVPGRISGRALAGDTLPFPPWEGDLPGFKPTGDWPPVSGHVYLPWRQRQDASLLIDLYPFVMLERDDRTGNRHLVVLSGRTQQRQWQRRSLSSGETRVWNPRPEEERVLRRVFGHGDERR